MARTKIKLNIARKIMGAVNKTKKTVKKNSTVKLNKALNLIVEEIQQVILDYNDGILERFEGDYSRRKYQNEEFDRNLPLIDTGNLFDSIEKKRRYGLNKLVGQVYSTASYYKDLDEGIGGVVKYKITQIALERVTPKLNKMLEEDWEVK